MSILNEYLHQQINVEEGTRLLFATCRYVQQIKTKLSCSICLDLYESPAATFECDDIFCKNCIQTYVQSSEDSKPPCPVCQTPISRKFVSLPSLNNAIEVATVCERELKEQFQINVMDKLSYTNIYHQVQRNIAKFRNSSQNKTEEFVPQNLIKVHKLLTGNDKIYSIDGSIPANIFPNPCKTPLIRQTKQDTNKEPTPESTSKTKRSLFVQHAAAAPNKKSNTKLNLDDSVKDFQNQSTKIDITQWLADNRNEFDRILTPEQTPANNAQVVDFNLASVSQTSKGCLAKLALTAINKHKMEKQRIRRKNKTTIELTLSNQQQAGSKRRARSLECSVSTIQKPTTKNRHSITIGEYPKSNIIIEEETSERAAKNVSTDSFKPRKKEKTVLQRTISVANTRLKKMKLSHWDNVNDIKKTIGKTEKKTQKLKIGDESHTNLTCSNSRVGSLKQNSPLETTDRILKTYNANEIENYFSMNKNTLEPPIQSYGLEDGQISHCKTEAEVVRKPKNSKTTPDTESSTINKPKTYDKMVSGNKTIQQPKIDNKPAQTTKSSTTTIKKPDDGSASDTKTGGKIIQKPKKAVKTTTDTKNRKTGPDTESRIPKPKKDDKMASDNKTSAAIIQRSKIDNKTALSTIQNPKKDNKTAPGTTTIAKIIQKPKEAAKTTTDTKTNTKQKKNLTCTNTLVSHRSETPFDNKLKLETVINITRVPIDIETNKKAQILTESLNIKKEQPKQNVSNEIKNGKASDLRTIRNDENSIGSNLPESSQFNIFKEPLQNSATSAKPIERIALQTRNQEKSVPEIIDDIFLVSTQENQFVGSQNEENPKVAEEEDDAVLFALATQVLNTSIPQPDHLKTKLSRLKQVVNMLYSNCHSEWSDLLNEIKTITIDVESLINNFGQPNDSRDVFSRTIASTQTIYSVNHAWAQTTLDSPGGFRISSSAFNIQPGVTVETQTDLPNCAKCCKLEAATDMQVLDRLSNKYTFSESLDNLDFDTPDISANKKTVNNRNKKVVQSENCNLSGLLDVDFDTQNLIGKQKTGTCQKNQNENAKKTDTLSGLLDVDFETQELMSWQKTETHQNKNVRKKDDLSGLLDVDFETQNLMGKQKTSTCLNKNAKKTDTLSGLLDVEFETQDLVGKQKTETCQNKNAKKVNLSGLMDVDFESQDIIDKQKETTPNTNKKSSKNLSGLLDIDFQTQNIISTPIKTKLEINKNKTIDNLSELRDFEKQEVTDKQKAATQNIGLLDTDLQNTETPNKQESIMGCASLKEPNVCSITPTERKSFKRIRMPSPRNEITKFKKNKFVNQDLSIYFYSEVQDVPDDPRENACDLVLSKDGINYDEVLDNIIKKYKVVPNTSTNPENPSTSNDSKEAPKRKLDYQIGQNTKRSKTEECVRECEMIIRDVCSESLRLEDTQCNNTDNPSKLTLAALEEEFENDIFSEKIIEKTKDEFSKTLLADDNVTKRENSNILNERSPLNDIIDKFNKLDDSFGDNLDSEVNEIFKNNSNSNVVILGDIRISNSNVTTKKDVGSLNTNKLSTKKFDEDNDNSSFLVSDSDSEIVESTPEKITTGMEIPPQPEYYNPETHSFAEEFFTEMSFIKAFTPPPEFQDFTDTVTPEMMAKSQMSSLTPDLLLPRNLSPKKQLELATSTQCTDASQVISSYSMNLSPIKKVQFQNAKVRVETPTSEYLSPQTSTPKQKSILNYVQPSKSARISQNSQRKPHVAYTRMTNEQVSVITSLVNKKLITCSTVFSPTVTHMIVSANENQCIKDHTMKFVLAVASGIWVVSFNWVEECLKQGRVLPEEPYEVLDMSGLEGPRQSRLKHVTSPLLKDFKIYAAPPFCSTTQQEVENVISLLGGKTVRRPDDLLIKDNKICIIITETKPSQDFEMFEIWLETLKVVTVELEWLSKSVAEYQLQSLRSFALCSKDFIFNLGYPAELLTAEVSYSFSQTTIE